VNCGSRWGAGWKKPVFPLEGVIEDSLGFLEDIVWWKGVGGWGRPFQGLLCGLSHHVNTRLEGEYRKLWSFQAEVRDLGYLSADVGIAASWAFKRL